MKLGELIAIARECKGWSQRDLERETGGTAVILEGKLIPHVMMFDRGDEIEFVLQNRLAFGFPREWAHQAACFAASAMAIGAGFPHFSGGKHVTQRDFAPGVTCLGNMPPQS